MRIDFSTTLKGFDGEVIKDGDGKPITLGSATVIALTAARSDDAQLSGEEKFRRGEIARIAWQSDKKKEIADLPVEDIALIKHAIGRGWSTLVVWSAFRIIESLA